MRRINVLVLGFSVTGKGPEARWLGYLTSKRVLTAAPLFPIPEGEDGMSEQWMEECEETCGGSQRGIP